MADINLVHTMRKNEGLQRGAVLPDYRRWAWGELDSRDQTLPHFKSMEAEQFIKVYSSLRNKVR